MIRIQAKVLIFSMICMSMLLTNVQDLNAKKRSRSDEFLKSKSLFFGGVHAGLSMSQVDGDNFAGYNKYNLNFSATAYTKIWDNVAISTELGYNTKGSRATNKQLPYVDPDGHAIQSYDITLGYAEIAVLGNVFDRKRNNIGTGIAYERLVSSKEMADGVLLTEFPFQKNTLDWVFNGELNILPERNIYINLRMQYSILPVRKNYNGTFGRPQQLNNQILIRLGYIF